MRRTDPAGDDRPDEGRGDITQLPAWAQEQLSGARRDASRYRRQVRELEAQPAGVGTASHQALARLEETESERDALRIRVAQLEAAVRHGIRDLQLVDLLTGTPEEIDDAAAALARHIPPTT